MGSSLRGLLRYTVVAVFSACNAFGISLAPEKVPTSERYDSYLNRLLRTEQELVAYWNVNHKPAGPENAGRALDIELENALSVVDTLLSQGRSFSTKRNSEQLQPLIEDMEEARQYLCESIEDLKASLEKKRELKATKIGQAIVDLKASIAKAREEFMESNTPSVSIQALSVDQLPSFAPDSDFQKTIAQIKGQFGWFLTSAVRPPVIERVGRYLRASNFTNGYIPDILPGYSAGIDTHERLSTHRFRRKNLEFINRTETHQDIKRHLDEISRAYLTRGPGCYSLPREFDYQELTKPRDDMLDQAEEMFPFLFSGQDSKVRKLGATWSQAHRCLRSRVEYLRDWFEEAMCIERFDNGFRWSRFNSELSLINIHARSLVGIVHAIGHQRHAYVCQIMEWERQDSEDRVRLDAKQALADLRNGARDGAKQIYTKYMKEACKEIDAAKRNLTWLLTEEEFYDRYIVKLKANLERAAADERDRWLEKVQDYKDSVQKDMDERIAPHIARLEEVINRCREEGLQVLDQIERVAELQYRELEAAVTGYIMPRDFSRQSLTEDFPMDFVLGRNPEA